MIQLMYTSMTKSSSAVQISKPTKQTQSIDKTQNRIHKCKHMFTFLKP